MAEATQALTLTEFLVARIAEDEATSQSAGADAMIGWRWKHLSPPEYERAQRDALTAAQRQAREAEAKRRVVEWHKAWPVLAQTPPTLEPVSGDPQSVTYRATQQIAWLTEQEYRTRFGEEPPSAPILRILAAVYADHPDYREEWRP